MPMLKMLATGVTDTVTVESGIEACFDALGNITSLITTYPFNIFFGCSIVFVGIGIFAAVKKVF